MTIEYKDSKRIVALSSDLIQTPTYSDDFSGTDDWADQGSGVGVNTTTDRLEFSSWTDNSTNNSSTLDLGSALSDTKWTIRFKLQWTGFSNTTDWTAPAIGMFSASSATAGNSAQDMLVYWSIANGATKRAYLSSADNSTISGTDHNLNLSWVLDTTYYIQLQRDGSNFSATVCTGSYEGTEVASGTDTIGGTVSGLQYFGVKSPVTSRGGSFTGWLDDLQIWNGILATSLPYRPTDVQDNSILVEKDTARRYWCDNPPSVTNQDIEWSSGNNVTISGNTLTATNGGWSCIARSVQTISPSRGGGTVIGKHSKLYGMLGFSKDPYWTSGNTFANGDYMIYHDEVYELGSAPSGSQFTGADNNTVYKLTMDSNGLVKYYADTGSGYTEVHESTVTAGANDEYYVLGVPDGSGSTVSDITITGKLATIWTMQPTFQDDFSSDKGWVSSDAQAKIDSSGYLLFDEDGDGSAHIVYYDIGRTLSDTKWLWRFKLTTHTFSMNSDPTPQMVHIRISDNTTQRDVASEDAIGMSFRTSDGNQKYIRTTYSDGAIFGTTSNFSTQIATGTHYVQITRDSSTEFTVKLYSDSLYSTLVESKSVTIPSTITDLRYLKIDNYDNDGTGNGRMIFHIDDMEVYSGVISKN